MFEVLNALELLEEERIINNNINPENLFFHNNCIKMKGF